MVAVHLFAGRGVGAETDPVLIIEKELSRAARLATELRLARSKFHHDVRAAIEQLGNVVKVLRPVGDVKGNKSGAGVLGENAVARRQDRLFARKLGTVEAPVGVREKLLVALVVLVDGMEESLGVGHVDGHGDSQPAALRPDGIEARVIHGDELARLVPDLEPEVFEDLQAAGAARNGIVNLAHHFLGEIRVVDLAPVDLREHREAAGIRLHHLVQDLLEAVAPRAGEDHDLLNIAAVHDLHYFFGRHMPAACGPRVIDVVVDVDHGKAGPLHVVGRGVEHRLGLEVAQEERPLFSGRRRVGFHLRRRAENSTGHHQDAYSD